VELFSASWNEVRRARRRCPAARRIVKSILYDASTPELPRRAAPAKERHVRGVRIKVEIEACDRVTGWNEDVRVGVVKPPPRLRRVVGGIRVPEREPADVGQGREVRPSRRDRARGAGARRGRRTLARGDSSGKSDAPGPRTTTMVASAGHRRAEPLREPELLHHVARDSNRRLTPLERFAPVVADARAASFQLPVATVRYAVPAFSSLKRISGNSGSSVFSWRVRYAMSTRATGSRAATPWRAR